MNEIDLNRLLELAGKDAELLEAELYRFSKILSANFELMDILCDARHPAELKKQVLNDAAPGSSRIMMEVLMLLVELGLCRNLPDISWKFTRLVAERNNIRYDEIIFSEKPSEEILSKFKKITGDKVRFRIEIDPKIIGGFIWRTMDGREMDASIAARLSQVKEEIKA